MTTAQKIAELAEQGFTPLQAAGKLRLTLSAIYKSAKAHNITFGGKQ